MTEVWLILGLLGAGIVLAVLVFNWWQERKYRHSINQSFVQGTDDVLDAVFKTVTPAKQKAVSETTPASDENKEGWMSEPRVRRSAMPEEPNFTVSIPQAKPANPTLATPSQAAANPSLSNATGLTAAGASVAADAPEPAPLATVNPTAGSATSDVLTRDVTTSEPLEAKAATAGESAMPAEAATTPDLALPSAVHAAMDWLGWLTLPAATLPSASSLQTIIGLSPLVHLWVKPSAQPWQRLTLPATAYPEPTVLLVALQLADRGGPVSMQVLQQLQAATEMLAGEVGTEVTWSHADPAAQAQAIDAFSIAVDKAVEFHLISEHSAFHATKLRGLAEAHGLQLTEQGQFESRDAGGHLQFVLRNYEGKAFSAEMLKTSVMSGVTFLLDIPVTLHNAQAFEHMLSVAQQFAHSLNAVMVDVNRKPIGDAHWQKIRQQLAVINDNMQGKGITPGSPLALRLFS